MAPNYTFILVSLFMGLGRVLKIGKVRRYLGC